MFARMKLNGIDGKAPQGNIQKYNIGGHFAELHTERENTSTMHRVFAWMTYLNDVKEGGRTEFVYYNKKIKPEYLY